MRSISVLIAAAFAAVANAHFQLQFPLPRGVYVGSAEPSFCDGYSNATTNRTVFPLSNGVINLNSGHPQWTIGVIISTQQNPTTFAAFNSSSGYQFAVPFFKTSGQGKFCFPINISGSGVSGVQDGANVTIQVVYNGGDTLLYQCADLTLAANATVPSNAMSGCTNITPSAAAPSPTATSKSSARKTVVTSGMAAAFLTGVAFLL